MGPILFSIGQQQYKSRNAQSCRARIVVVVQSAFQISPKKSTWLQALDLCRLPLQRGLESLPRLLSPPIFDSVTIHALVASADR